jgi:hypothetical protein
LAEPRIGLYKSWVRTNDAAWLIWLLEEFEFPFHLVPDGEIKAGNLRERFDVIILPDQAAASIIKGHDKDTIPPEYVGGITPEGVKNLREFAEQGGTVIFNKSSCDLAIDYFNLGVKNLLRDVPAKSFNCPGSLVKVEYDTDHPITFGMEEMGVGFFSGAGMRDKFLGGYVFANPQEIEPSDEDNPEPNVNVVARYPDESLLISGWLVGGEKIRGQAAILEIAVGRGRAVLFGFNVLNRGHSYSTIKLLFNAIYLGSAK